MGLCQHQIMLTLLECVCECTMPALEAVDIRGSKLIRCGPRALWVLLSRRILIFFPEIPLSFDLIPGQELSWLPCLADKISLGDHLTEQVIMMSVNCFPFFPFGRLQYEWLEVVGNGAGHDFRCEGETQPAQSVCSEQVLSDYARATIWT